MLWPAQFNIQDLLAEFFGIDLKKLEAEKRQMLTELNPEVYGGDAD